MARNSLTDKKCQSLGPGRHSDGNGLYLEVKPKGTSRSWCLIYQLNGKRRQMGLGPYPEVSLAEARMKAAERRKIVRVDKVDPMGVMGQRSAGLKQFEVYAEEYIKSREPNWTNEKSVVSWRNSLRDYVNPHIGSKAIESITSDDIYNLLVKDNFWIEKQETAIRVRGRMKKVFDYAMAQSAQIVRNPAGWEGNLEPRLQIVSKRIRTTHLRSLPYKFAPPFLTDLKSKNEMSAKAMIWVLLTACRTANVCRMKWDYVDFDNLIWTCPASTMKNKQEFKVPFSRTIGDWLQSIPRIDELVFPAKKGKEMSNNTLLALLKRMEYKDLTTTHGLRSTFSTWANEQTMHQSGIIEAALSHRIGDATSQAYNRSELLEKRRKLMFDWQEFLGF
jgi:integrase